MREEKGGERNGDVSLRPLGANERKQESSSVRVGCSEEMG